MHNSVLGINSRNVDYIMQLNKRCYFPMVDEKLETKKILAQNEIPSPALYTSINRFFDVNEFILELSSKDNFALKPSRGYGGEGIVIVNKVEDNKWYVGDSEIWEEDEQSNHVRNILYGVYAIDNDIDSCFAEELIKIDPFLEKMNVAGVPDIRVIVFKGKAVCAMLRMPTSKSGGRANLHTGGFAVGIDIQTGITQKGWYRGREILKHPELDLHLEGLLLPYWNKIIRISNKLRDIFPLDYMGVDFVIDKRYGPLVLEINARPGLEIQNVIGQGLLSVFGEGGKW